MQGVSHVKRSECQNHQDMRKLESSYADLGGGGGGGGGGGVAAATV